MSVTKETFLSDVAARSPRSSTAPSPNSNFKRDSYDVFLSFRGLDTRKKFSDHLYEALKREGFHTFRDEDEIEWGEIIKLKLQNAIENSRMSIIVFSKNFLNSTACLFEIRTIIEHRKKKSDHLILPVFYEVEVDPWEIKEQAKNLDSGEKKLRADKVKGWGAALEEVLSIVGRVSQNQSNGYEAKFIEEIVGEIKSKLSGNHLRVADYPAQNQYSLLDAKIKVKVVNIMGPFLSKDGNTTYKRFMLLDEKATMFEKEIETYKLEMHSTYLISRALLTKVDTEHKRVSLDEHAREITLKYFSIIEEVENEGINPAEIELSFIPLCHIPELKPMAPQIHVVAIVMGISQEENRKRKRDRMDITFRDIILVDSSHYQPTTLATWGRFIHDECDTLANMLHRRPIIVATNLRLKDVEGKRCISTSHFSEILINPEIPEAKKLEAWKLENENVLKNISTKSGSSLTLSMNTIQEIKDMAAMASRMRRVGDSTVHLPAILFGTHAEKILACEANQLIACDKEVAQRRDTLKIINVEDAK
ncbi:hypothetical protein RHGRI_032486 [Rhododendron griersonianum]|uniref:ADP-ribosyl cyclase/cyclic ADP-ribose hydrolase n=1 Tax=Rhododendron griersonianum TaxID=479676 RepID=A0AAV6ICP1_9ERIC|nr:hypothetical protein RHGRI_032486 [Rhododendron griersonianum]